MIGGPNLRAPVEDDPANDDEDSSSSTASITSISSPTRRSFASFGSSDPADEDDDDDETVTVDPDSQTIEEMAGEVESSTSDDPSIEVQETDPDASSPAGGAGETSAAARFAGEDEDDVDDPIATAQETSDEFTARQRLADRAGLDVDPSEAVGSLTDGSGVLETQAGAFQDAARDRVGELELPSVGGGSRLRAVGAVAVGGLVAAIAAGGVR